MSDQPTPETDKAEYEVRLGKHRRKVVRPDLCRKLERQRDQLLEGIGELASYFESTGDATAARQARGFMASVKEGMP